MDHKELRETVLDILPLAVLAAGLIAFVTLCLTGTPYEQCMDDCDEYIDDASNYKQCAATCYWHELHVGD